MPRCLPTAALAILTLTGCVGAGGVAMHRGVLDYDRAVARTQAEMLLLNVARARQGDPLHFTTVSGITATFEYRLDAGLGADVPEGSGPIIAMPSLAAGVTESPTASIVPLRGQAFTERLLAPIDESQLTYFIARGDDPALVLRLLAAEFVPARSDGNQERLRNDPARASEYRSFRQRVLRLARLGQTNRLWVDPIRFERRQLLSAATDAGIRDHLDALTGEHDIETLPDGRLRLSRNVTGRIAITDYDPAQLPNNERRQLHELANRRPDHFVFVDIQGGESGGTGAARGWFRLRSLDAVIQALARNIDHAPEFAVTPDAATGPVEDNPDSVLRIDAAGRPHPQARFQVEYADRHYAIANDPDADHYRRAFGVLSRLFELAVADLGDTLAPPVTISK